MDSNIIEKNTQTLENSSKKLKEIESIANNTEIQSLNAIQTLKSQGEKIDNFNTVSINMNSDIVESVRHLKKIESENKKFKIMLTYIIIILILLIIMIYKIKK